MTLRRACVLVGLLAFGWCLLALPARGAYQSRTVADEPQYLLSALSLWDDLSLDIADELDDERWRDFHEGPLPEQTRALDGGERLSPHDPLLPAVLAVPMGLGGWAAAKATLAALAGALAALLVWTAHRRFAVPVGVAAVVVGACAVSAPFAAYGAQVYPELPAAVAVAVAVAALTGPLGRRGQWVFGLAVVALPWLAVKYVPVAAALVVLAALRLRRAVWPLVGGLAASGLAYVVGHRLLYDGWTVYASGDHFVEGEHTVIGRSPDLPGRSRRLLGLLVDRGFGLAAWAPVWLLLPAALGAMVRRRAPHRLVLVVPLAAGWATATWVALTMHGWWWPGRQVVAVLPLAALALAWWAAQVRWAPAVVGALGATGALVWGWLVVEVLRMDRRLVIDFEATSNPLVQAWQWFLPEMRSPTAGDWVRYALWAAALGASVVASIRSQRPQRKEAPCPSVLPSGPRSPARSR